MGNNESKHLIQKLIDNPWLLLLLGVLVPTISYTVWGMVKLLQMPPAALP